MIVLKALSWVPNKKHPKVCYVHAYVFEWLSFSQAQAIIVSGKLTGTEAIANLGHSHLALISQSVRAQMSPRPLSVEANLDKSQTAPAPESPTITLASYYSSTTFKDFLPVFYTDVKKTSELGDDLVRFDNGATVLDTACMVKAAYRKPKDTQSWIKLGPMERYMFRTTTKSAQELNLRLRVRMAFAYPFLKDLTVSNKQILRRTIGLGAAPERKEGGWKSDIPSERDLQNTVETENYIATTYINDYSISIGCDSGETYRLELTIVPKVLRNGKSRQTSRLCRPDDPDLAGIDTYMPKLADVSNLTPHILW